jgi:hypothetical protein
MSVKTEIKMKLCRKCNILKPLEEGYYKAGLGWQKYCRPCHNRLRTRWVVKSSYVKKGSGFQRLSDQIQQNILKDIEDKVSYSEISRKYDINYITLMYWKKKNRIGKI